VTVQGTKALTSDSKCNCSYTGSIEIKDAKATVEVG
jgi:hypothetical protein